MNKIETIKKLLASADKSRNSSEEEAEVAMQMALKLMQSEGLTQEDINKSSIEDEYGVLGENLFNGEKEYHRILNWKKVLISSIAFLFDCKIIENTLQGKHLYTILGRESNRITSELMYNWIHDRTMKEAREKYGNQTAKRNSYCMGVANGISKKVHQLKKEAPQKNAWGIVPINEVVDYMKKTHPEVKQSNISFSYTDSSAYSNGKSVGENTSLNKQFGLKGIEKK